MLYSECRSQCLQDLQVVLKTAAGTPVVDILRFFNGDGPAQQFEAGHKIGGKYSCVRCGALTSRFDDVITHQGKHSLSVRNLFSKAKHEDKVKTLSDVLKWGNFI